MKHHFRTYIVMTAVLCTALPGLSATITIDENGHGDVNGTPLAFTTNGTNPNPPFQTGVLQYTLPFSGISGNVELIEPETGIPGDVLQFLGNGTVNFYSKPDADNSLAERYTPPIPPAPVPNTVILTETGSPGNDGAIYTPTAGQPGYDTSGPTYHFISDSPSASTVPEPASLALLALGGIAALMIGKLKLQS